MAYSVCTSTYSFLVVLALRSEFLRARARCLRYRENVKILLEEQRRTLVSLEKNAIIWETRARDYVHDDHILWQGAAAYASKQAAIQRLLADKFRALWIIQDETAARKAARARDKAMHATGDSVAQNAPQVDDEESGSDEDSGSDDEDLRIDGLDDTDQED